MCGYSADFTEMLFYLVTLNDIVPANVFNAAKNVMIQERRFLLLKL